MNNVVRVYGTNDMPKLLIEHFLEYISLLPLEINNGNRINSFKEIINFYIIANEEDKQIKPSSIGNYANIVVKNETTKDIIENSKSFVYDGSNNKELLDFIIDKILEIGILPENTLLNIEKGPSDFLHEVADAYIRNDVFQMYLYGAKLYENEEVLQMAFKNYKNFINEIENLEECDLKEYILSRAKYEIDVICKNNNYELLYPEEFFDKFKNKIISKHESHEMSCLLQAMILSDISSFYAKAANEFANRVIASVPYALYKRGLILFKEDERTYGDVAENYFKWAIYYKKDYYEAYYALLYKYYVSLSKDGYGKKKMSTEIFDNFFKFSNKIQQLLYNKWNSHSLSYKELEIIYQSAYLTTDRKTKNESNYSASAYAQDFKELYKELDSELYLYSTWPDVDKHDGIKKSIKDSAKKQLTPYINYFEQF